MPTFDQNPYDLLESTPTPPVSIIKRRKVIAHKDGFLENAKRGPDGLAETEWAIEHHRTLKTGHVDWKGTAQELAQQLGEANEKRAIAERLHHNAQHTITWNANMAKGVERDVLAPLRKHWLRHFLPVSVQGRL